MHDAQPRITLAAFEELCAHSAPFVHYFDFRTEEIGVGTARVRLPYDEEFVRPGGTVSGPAMMALADFTLWAALLGAIGEVPLAVTTSLNINFLRKPANTDIICTARLLKLGRRLAVGDLVLTPEGEGLPCAHVTATYSIPPGNGDSEAVK